MPEPDTRPPESHRRDFWDERYRLFPDLFGERPNDFLVSSEVLLPRGGRVLVVGDGQGRNGVWLARRGFRVTAVDLSEVACRQARERAVAAGVEIEVIHADLLEWATAPASQGPWDAIVWIFLHLSAHLRHRLAGLLGPRLAPGGVLVMETYSTDQPAARQAHGAVGGPRDPALLSRPQDAAEDWPCLEVESRQVDRRVFEGRGHQGTSSTVQVLGRPRPRTGPTPRRGVDGAGASDVVGPPRRIAGLRGERSTGDPAAGSR